MYNISYTILGNFIRNLECSEIPVKTTGHPGKVESQCVTMTGVTVVSFIQGDLLKSLQISPHIFKAVTHPSNVKKSHYLQWKKCDTLTAEL